MRQKSRSTPESSEGVAATFDGQLGSAMWRKKRFALHGPVPLRLGRDRRGRTRAATVLMVLCCCAPTNETKGNEGEKGHRGKLAAALHRHAAG